MIAARHATPRDADVWPLEDFLDLEEMLLVKSDSGDMSRTNPDQLLGGRGSITMTQEQFAALAAHSRSTVP